MEVPSARQCSDYIVVLRHLERKHERLSAYCLDFIGALLFLFKKDSWRVVERGGLKFQFRNLPVQIFQKNSWTVSGWQVAFAPAGSELVSGEFLERGFGDSKDPWRVIQSHLTLQLFPERIFESEEDSSSGSLDSTAISPAFPGGILRRRRDFPNLRTLAAFQDVEEGGESESIEVDELVEADEEDTVRNLQSQFDAVAHD